jgi:hypothetical protein
MGMRETVLGLELREQPIEIMDVPWSIDLRQHNDVELLAHFADNLYDLVKRPRRRKRVYADPQLGRLEFDRPRHIDKALPCVELRLDRHAVLEIAEEHIHLAHKFLRTRAQFLHMRWNEMNHPFEPHRRFAKRLRRANGKRLIEVPGKRHGCGFPTQPLLTEAAMVA